MDNYNQAPVENEQYCMPSMNKRNVDEMTNMMGYHDMSDRANTKPFPNNMQGNKVNAQPMGKPNVNKP